MHTMYTIPMLRLSVHSVHQCAPPISLMRCSRALVRATVEKACADRALCVLVVPVAILAQYWSKLLYASVLPLGAPFTEDFIRIRSPALHLRHLGDYAPEELAVFACDFGRLEPRPGLPSLSDCPGAVAPRPSTPYDRLRLREALLARQGACGGGCPE